MDYAELIVEVALRCGLPEIPARAAHFVTQAERDLQKVLRVRQMEAEATVTTDADGKAAIPADYLALRDIIDNGSIAVVGDEFWTETVEGDVTVQYYAALPSVVTNMTNWLLDEEPEIYINAVLLQIYTAAGDPRAQPTAAILAERVAGLKRADKLARYSGQRIDIRGLA